MLDAAIARVVACAMLMVAAVVVMRVRGFAEGRARVMQSAEADGHGRERAQRDDREEKDEKQRFQRRAHLHRC